MTHAATRWHVSHRRRIEYDILSAPDLLDPGNPALLSSGRSNPGRRFVVVDEHVAQHCSAALDTYFAQHGIEARIVRFPGGEAAKTMDAWLGILHELDAFPIHRRDEPIIAIGGGVLTDVVGFVASSYRRGMPHIKVPTTLMGYVDASVGIKTGVNFNRHKNRLGSFEAPRQVLLDRAFLTTLPHRHILNGVCEIIKLAVIKDVALFEQLEQHGTDSIASCFQSDHGGRILDRAISGMLEELQPNLFENELARNVDFGHTFSYGLETHHEERLLHGEAVLLDIAVSVLIARRRGLLDAVEVERVFALIAALGITLDTGVLDTDLMWHSLLDRIEHRNGWQRVPLPDGLGHCVFVNDINPAEITASIESLIARTSRQHDPVLEC
ncbi:MAG: iron-containing alcohol dehydrogenase [Rhodanobacter sp.]|nr:MAG: iron-containing alcohol dehydrogenase [Rhodanobacter sp.]TAM38475.1 MAG: iron-containing alcohol dehydrogenase [Rhodanobacter sp.]TAN27041.1 MAG: iron-containing alcohol dehydrogenase [Rhodanobacter sp.]